MPLFSAKELANFRVFETGAEKIAPKEFDIFLSHSYEDKKFVDKIDQVFNSAGHSVYVDWKIDHELDRSKVTVQTADLLRKRMLQSKCLFFLTSSNSPTSRWMPWELGYFDGLKHKVA